MSADITLVDLSPALGVEVRGVDLRKPAPPAVAERLRQAFRERLLVLFRGQHLSEEEQVRAVGVFGPPLDEFADGSGYSLVSNVDRDAYIGGAFSDNELLYHSDLTNTDAPPWGLSLHGLDVAGDAPSTRYVNVQYAYDRLPQDLREQLDGLTVIDAYEDEAYGEAAEGASPKRLAGHLSTHPAVIEHPRNGRRQVYCNQMWTHRILGMEKPQATALLERLFAELYVPANMYEHRWATGDLVVWDNIGLQHGRDPIPDGCRRRLRRVPIGENKPRQVDASRRGRERSIQEAASR